MVVVVVRETAAGKEEVGVLAEDNLGWLLKKLLQLLRRRALLQRVLLVHLVVAVVVIL